MKNSGLTDDDLSRIIAECKQRPEIEEAVLYGSRALGTFNRGSDVDIAVKGQQVTFDTCAALHFALEEETPLPYFFDITDYNAIRNKALQAHIDRFGKTIYRKEDRLTADKGLLPEDLAHQHDHYLYGLPKQS